jgi:SAM-dependent methyltransferase
MIEALQLVRRFARRGKSNHDYQAMQTLVAERMLFRLQQAGIDLKRSSVLEVGAGAGGYSRVLHQACGAFVASDVNRNDFFNGSRIPFETIDVMEIPSIRDTFDVIICASLIEHVEKPVLALSNLRQMLKPGGRLFLTFPPFYSLWMLGGHRFKPFHFLGEKLAVRIYNWRHPHSRVKDYRTCGGNYGLFPLTIGRVERLLAQSGFRVVSRYDRHLPFNPARWPGVLKDLFTIHVCCLAEKV